MRQPHNVQLRNFVVALSATTLASPVLGFEARADNVPAENPNITGKVPVKGFRLDQKYPGDWGSEDEQGGWFMQLNITTTTDDGDFFAVKLLPPSAGNEGAVVDKDGKWLVSEDASKSWALTALGFSIMEFPKVPGGNDMEDGSCSDIVFSGQCRKDFITAIKENINKWQEGYIGPDFLEAPTSCEQFKNVISQAIRTDDLENFTKDSRFGWSYNTGTNHAWNEFRERTWPFIFVWAPSGDQKLDDDHIQFSCVKADKDAKTGESLITSNATTTAEGPSSTPPTGTSTPAPVPAGASRAGTVGILSVFGMALLSFGMGML